MSRHEGVSCDSCLKGNFRGRRYKCLICYDYDLCAACYEAGATTTRHTTDHPMQCILTRSDFEMYYGGEGLTVEQPQAFTCPYCGRQGLTEGTLQEHVASEHADTSFEVVCPVCASLPGGDPNHVTDDFAGHLTLEHRSGPRDLISFLDEPAVSRHGGVRRIPHSTRGSGVPRARRSNMHFSSSGGLSSLSPSSRDVDPIAELLSQLSGVRRSAAAAAAAAVTGAGSSSGAGGSSVASTPSQLQQLQMQLQLERHQAARQQLERLPRRQAQASGAGNSAVGLPVSSNPLSAVASMAGASANQSGVVGDHLGAASGHSSTQPSSQFLLARSLEHQSSELELQEIEEERAERSLFVQELVLSTLAEETSDNNISSNSNTITTPMSIVNPQQQPQTERSIPSISSQQIRSIQQPIQHTSVSSNPTATKRSTSTRNPSTVTKASSSSNTTAPILHAPILQIPMRVVTGTGTIRESNPVQQSSGVVPRVPPAGSGVSGGGIVRGTSPPSNATRRKPTRPIEGRNQASEPPPPH